MKFAIWEHAGKGSYLRQVLLSKGHTAADTIAETDLLLLDCDWKWAHPRPELIQTAKAAGAKVALFPHGGLPTIFIYDGLTEPDDRVDLRLEHGQGSVEVAETLGLDLKQHATGWLFSPTEPFHPVSKPRRLLFCPQHPNMETINAAQNGHDPGPQLNQKVYRQLLDLDYEITVSLVGPAFKNGVWRHPGVTFVGNPQMSFPQSYELVRSADVVVGAGTMAACAIACGKPTVMLGQGNYADYIDGEYTWPTNTDVYADTLRYPIDVEYGDLSDLILQACEGDNDAAKWRETFIGDDGTNNAVDLLEELVGEPSTSSASVIIEGVTATAKLNL